MIDPWVAWQSPFASSKRSSGCASRYQGHGVLWIPMDWWPPMPRIWTICIHDTCDMWIWLSMPHLEPRWWGIWWLGSSPIGSRSVGNQRDGDPKALIQWSFLVSNPSFLIPNCCLVKTHWIHVQHVHILIRRLVNTPGLENPLQRTKINRDEFFVQRHPNMTSH